MQSSGSVVYGEYVSDLELFQLHRVLGIPVVTHVQTGEHLQTILKYISCDMKG